MSMEELPFEILVNFISSKTQNPPRSVSKKFEILVNFISSKTLQ